MHCLICSSRPSPWRRAGGPDPAADLPVLLSQFLQITQTEVQQGQQQFSQFTDGQVGYPAWAGAENEKLGELENDIRGFGWLGPLSHLLLKTGGQKLLKQVLSLNQGACPLDLDLWELNIILDII